VDVLFANAGEALALAAAPPVRALLEAQHAQRQDPEGAAAAAAAAPAMDGLDAEGLSGAALPPARSAAEAAEQLSQLCPLTVVTDGSRCGGAEALLWAELGCYFLTAADGHRLP
jgi:hypothetical protein